MYSTEFGELLPFHYQWHNQQHDKNPFLFFQNTPLDDAQRQSHRVLPTYNQQQIYHVQSSYIQSSNALKCNGHNTPVQRATTPREAPAQIDKSGPSKVFPSAPLFTATAPVFVLSNDVIQYERADLYALPYIGPSIRYALHHTFYVLSCNLAQSLPHVLATPPRSRVRAVVAPVHTLENSPMSTELAAQVMLMLFYGGRTRSHVINSHPPRRRARRIKPISTNEITDVIFDAATYRPSAPLAITKRKIATIASSPILIIPRLESPVLSHDCQFEDDDNECAWQKEDSVDGHHCRHCPRLRGPQVATGRPFICSHPGCGEAFSLKGNAAAHYNFCHTVVKDFCCPVCGANYARNDFLERHMCAASHPNEFHSIFSHPAS